ncbi:hypothetical protein ISN45_Aa02g002480 [Arabidopsis thaliana x Arabidopsis arenosa]|uniref:Uncharacterized protein n=1 Tax=Arabidopsis thaliana x Arabidopsis arenosa TaxID=1240361 RepID=A0A8T2BDE1_9BRAS|nr:hypothetical protein ISN45_Aa02g002480 [Arabidopsis thaliana x Arabidopsis arenosa]
MRYKRRFVTVYRDFPEGCGVPSKHLSNADEFLMQSKFKSHGDFLDITKESSNHSETETSITEESILESNGSVKDHQEEEGIGESEDKQNEMSSVKKRCLSSHNSTMEVETDVVDVSKRVIVSGLLAKSKCPWRQPKNQGSRQEKRRR